MVVLCLLIGQLSIHLRLNGIIFVKLLLVLTLWTEDIDSFLIASDTRKLVLAKRGIPFFTQLFIDAFNLRPAFVCVLKRYSVVKQDTLDDVRALHEYPPLARVLFSTRSRLGFRLHAQRVIQTCYLNRRRSRQTTLSHAVCEDANLIDLVGVTCNFFQCRSALRSLLPHAIDLGLDCLVREYRRLLSSSRYRCRRSGVGGSPFRRHCDEVHILVVELRRFVQHQHTCDALFFRNARPTQAIPLLLDIVFRALWVAQRHAVVERRRDVFNKAVNV